jgi:hypothetical protein
MTAFVDESQRHGPKGIYIIAAVVVTDDLDTARQSARSMLLRGQRRFHWRDENDRRRRLMMQRIIDLDVVCRAYRCQPVTAPQSPRARALCLNGLLWDLRRDDINELVIESRQDHNDRQDRRTIANAQRAQRADPGLRYRFSWPESEPMLWLADAVAGAVSASAGGKAEYVEALGVRLALSDIVP